MSKLGMMIPGSHDDVIFVYGESDDAKIFRVNLKDKKGKGKRVKLLASGIGYPTCIALHKNKLAIATRTKDEDGARIYMIANYTRNYVAKPITDYKYSKGVDAVAWSPDGTGLAYVRDSLLYLVSVSGSEIQLSDDLVNGKDVLWANDQTILFVRGRPGNGISVIDITNGCQTNPLHDSPYIQNLFLLNKETIGFTFDKNLGSMGKIYTMDLLIKEGQLGLGPLRYVHDSIVVPHYHRPTITCDGKLVVLNQPTAPGETVARLCLVDAINHSLTYAFSVTAMRPIAVGNDVVCWNAVWTEDDWYFQLCLIPAGESLPIPLVSEEELSALN